jgi:flagellar basal body-associated protein FliL
MPGNGGALPGLLMEKIGDVDMTQDGSRVLFSILMCLIVMLMLAIAGLFRRMIQLQRTVLAALGLLQVLTSDATYIPWVD